MKLLITEFQTIYDRNEEIIGHIRHRQDPRNIDGENFWQVRKAGSGEWFGTFASQEEAEAALRS